MPSKKKGTSQKSAKAKTPTLINGLTVEETSKEQIEEHIARLREEVDREREERNYFQLERDEVDTFREVSDRKLEVIKSEQLIEDDEEQFQEEIRVYKLKIKHLLCEHENTISELKADGLVTAEVQQKEQDQLKRELLKKKRAIMVDIQELDSDNLVRELELKCIEEMATTRNNWERQFTEVAAKKREKMQQLQHDLENLRKNGILEKEFQEIRHIFDVKEDHHKIQGEIMNKSEMGKEKMIKIEEKCSERSFEMNEDVDMPSVMRDTVSAEPVTKAKKDVVKRTEFCPNKKDSILSHKKALEDLKLEHEIMEQKFSKLQLQRDELFSSFPQKIQSLQDEAELGNTLLKRKLQALTDSLEKTQAQLYSLLSAPNMDHTGLSVLTNQILENLEFRKSAIKNLECKRNVISGVHLLQTAEANQRARCGPMNESLL